MGPLSAPTPDPCRPRFGAAIGAQEIRISSRVAPPLIPPGSPVWLPVGRFGPRARTGSLEKDLEPDAARGLHLGVAATLTVTG